MMHDVIPVVVDAAFVRAHPEAVLADVRWYLTGTNAAGQDGRTAYEAAHLPGAIWVDLDHDLAAHGLDPTEGRHPFPTADAFAQSMGDLGIGDGRVVVAYDDSGGMQAGRLVVMLRMLGHDAAVLDGGLAAWDGPIESGFVEPTSAGFTTVPWPTDRFASADEAAALAASPDSTVIDARAHDRFTGEATLMDPRPGHIPGAVSAPWASVLEDGRFRSPADLRDHFESIGVRDDRPTAAYCGSGVSACMNMVAMELAGFEPPRLYVASWSGWSADPERPAELGA